MKMQCPNCGREYEFAPEALGSNFTCRECMKRFKVSAPALPERAAEKRRNGVWMVIAVIVLAAALAGGGGFLLWKKLNVLPAPPEKTVNKLDARAEEIIAVIRQKDSWRLAEKLRGFDVNWRDKNGETLLFYGVRSGDVQLVQTLLGWGFSVDVRNRRGETPLFAAVGSRDLPMFRFLIGKGCDPEVTSESDSIWSYAAGAGCADILQYMSLAGFRLIDGVPGSDPAIFRALKNRHDECVRIVLQHCRVKDLYDRQGNSFGIACIRAQKWEWARKAIDKSNVDHCNKEGRNALYYTCLSDNAVMLDYLLHLKPHAMANVMANSPLMAAISAGSSYAVNKLLRYGTTMELLDDEGNNFLMLAARKGDMEIFSAIYSAHKFDLLHKNREGKTVYQIAAANGFADITSALTESYVKAVKPLVAQRLKQLADSKATPEKVTAKLNDMLREFDGLEEIVNMIEELSKKVADAAGSKAAPEEPEENKKKSDAGENMAETDKKEVEK